MYLIDTNVVSELRKHTRCNAGVKSFFTHIQQQQLPIFLSVITVGELRRGVELIRHRGDVEQASLLSDWLEALLVDFHDAILDVDTDVAQVWGGLRCPHHENAVDKLIAATALVHGLVVVTRNEKDFSSTGVETLNPFQ